MEDKEFSKKLESLFAKLNSQTADVPTSPPPVKDVPAESEIKDDLPPSLVNDVLVEKARNDILELDASPKKSSNILCTHLGIIDDINVRYTYPTVGHRCFADGKPFKISLEHQAEFCLTQQCQQCPRYLDPTARQAVVPSLETTEEETETAAKFIPQPEKKNAPWGVMVWMIVGLLIIGVSLYYNLYLVDQPALTTALSGPIIPPPPTNTPTPDQSAPSNVGSPQKEVTPTPTASPTVTSEAAIPTASSVNNTLAQAASAATPIPEGQEVVLTAASSDVGWLASGEERGNHFRDSFLYAGIFKGQIYHGAFQFDLSTIERGAPIYKASIQVTGLNDERLGNGGFWALRMLDGDIDLDWSRHNYQDIFSANAIQTLFPILDGELLEPEETYTFEFSDTQLKLLEKKIIDVEEPKISFRFDGPVTGSDNLFAWDTGYGSQSAGNRVTLSLGLGSAPATPPPFDFVIVTSTPTPENVATAMAVMLDLTAQATRVGTATPTPRNLVTPTPIPDYLVVVNTPIPENAATAQVQSVLETAIAVTTGTATPIPTNAVTATPTPTETSTPLPPATATYVLITATPTPESVFAAATQAAVVTFQAQRIGTATPFPANWVTPIVVTSTPTPFNQATAQYMALESTARAFAFGEPTPTPGNFVTATSTPPFTLLNGELPPMTATPVPTPKNRTIPPELIGKIAFKSDRSGVELLYVINPDGSGLALLPDSWPYDLAREADAYSTDGRYFVVTRDALRYDDGKRTDAPALFWLDKHYNTDEQLTFFGSGMAYDGVWSPTAERIALVSNDSGNDEIWVMNRDGSELTQLTHNQWEWDKHPSWSPDGQQIAFWSNRTGNFQIYVMNADGTYLHSLSRTGFNDWDPVWIKYPRIPFYQAP